MIRFQKLQEFFDLLSTEAADVAVVVVDVAGRASTAPVESTSRLPPIKAWKISRWAIGTTRVGKRIGS
jgi:hypothetical protein